MRARVPVPIRVDLEIDQLVLPDGVGDAESLRAAVTAALEEGLTQRLDGATLASSRLGDVSVSLREPVAAGVDGIGRQVAAEVIRAVLP
ncbi:hypothetical protein [uncultured Microbacterium sp.]|uniref:hypothetical protein n=1 Tax=uncultured Microbacterium sp. TaxID=191216 RepID=UPI002609F633|nr:hypothetical protein [uncultured Microbacterium sp.]